jgi:hypothetical protein
MDGEISGAMNGNLARIEIEMKYRCNIDEI